MENPKFRVDIEVYDNWGDGYWAQARYLAHGYDDVMWTDSLDDAAQFIMTSVRENNGQVSD